MTRFPDAMFAAAASTWSQRSVLLVGESATGLADSVVARGGVPVLEPSDEGGELGGAIVTDVLPTCSTTDVEHTMRAIHDRLRPGATCLVHVRTWLAADGGGLGERLRTPFAHLAFARAVIEAYYEERGWGVPPLHNPMNRASYLVVFRRAGFDIDEVVVERQTVDVFLDKLRLYDEEELACATFAARLSRPVDNSSALEELRSTRVKRQ